MRHDFYPIWVLFALLFFLTSCNTPISQQDDTLQGRILVWHDWSGAEAEVLDELFGKFNDIYPDVKIIRSAISLGEDNLHEEFVRHVQAGLGPDLLIFRASSIPEFVESGLIQSLDTRKELDLSYFSSQAEALTYREQLYGLPFSFSTDVLYYNSRLVQQPPATLPELLKEAYAGKGVALDSSFEGAFWGIQAFGGRLFDQDGEVKLNQGGFNNWLGWLKNTQNVPNMILSPNQDTLYELFKNRQVAYYVGSSRELPKLQAELGKEVIRVAPLPAGPIERAGPLLQTEALMFSRASDEDETELALRLAEFLTNVEQQTILGMKEIGRLPTNSRVTIDERVSPIAAAFAKQSNTAITLPLAYSSRMKKLVPDGDEVYAQVLAGIKGRNEAINQLSEEINANNPVTVADKEPESTCIEGRIRVQHGWNEAEAKVLEEIRRRFMLRCPKSIVDIVAAEADSTSRYVQYRDSVVQGKGPDLLIDSTDLGLFTLMISNDLILDISELVEPTLLQSFVPQTQDAMRSNGKLYGLPLSMDVMALYYNKEMVSELPTTIDDLLAQANPKQQVALPLGFQETFWGVPAFGGQLFDSKNQVILNKGGFVEWLEWLREAQTQSGVRMSSHPDELLELFIEEEAAYLISENKQLTLLQQELGREHVGVTSLPAGPRGAAGPPLTVEGLMFNPASSEIDLALEFATFATSIENQYLLLEENKRVPANVNVDVRAIDPAIAEFVEQTKTATVLPNTRELSKVWNQGAWFDYEAELRRDVNLQERVDKTTNSINEYNYYVLNAKKPVLSCEGEGSVLLWHSWDINSAKGEGLDALTQDFMDSCPRIQIETLFVPPDDLPTQLSTAEVQQPDFILAPHDLITALAADKLIKAMPSISTQDRANLGRLHEWATDAFKQDGLSYGLPVTGDVLALYYDPEWVENPAETLEELLHDTSETPVALDSSFYGAYWGLSTFGGQVFNAEGQQEIKEDGFIEWLRWLKAAQNEPNVLLSDDQDTLQARFASGEVAYLVAGVEGLTTLSFASDTFRVTSLPAGPNGEANPFLQVEGFLFAAKSSTEQTSLAYQFSEFATSVYSQKELMEQAALLPANQSVQVELNSPLAHFAEHAGESILLPPRSDASIIFEAGNQVYQNVLENDQSPNQAVSTFKTKIVE